MEDCPGCITSHCARGTLYSITHCCYHMTHLPGQCRRKQTDKNFVVNRGSEPLSCKKITLNQTTLQAPHLICNQINTVQKTKTKKIQIELRCFSKCFKYLRCKCGPVSPSRNLLNWVCDAEFLQPLWVIDNIEILSNFDSLQSLLIPVRITSHSSSSWNNLCITTTMALCDTSKCHFMSSLILLNRKREIMVEHKHKLSHTFPPTCETAASRCTTRKYEGQLSMFSANWYLMIWG